MRVFRPLLARASATVQIPSKVRPRSYFTKIAENRWDTCQKRTAESPGNRVENMLTGYAATGTWRGVLWRSSTFSPSLPTLIPLPSPRPPSPAMQIFLCRGRTSIMRNNREKCFEKRIDRKIYDKRLKKSMHVYCVHRYEDFFLDAIYSLNFYLVFRP